MPNSSIGGVLKSCRGKFRFESRPDTPQSFFLLSFLMYIYDCENFEKRHKNVAFCHQILAFINIFMYFESPLNTTRDFRLQVFFHESVPRAPEYPTGAALNFYNNFTLLYFTFVSKSVSFIAGVVDFTFEYNGEFS
jgi:hypothetical protein